MQSRSSGNTAATNSKRALDDDITCFRVKGSGSSASDAGFSFPPCVGQLLKKAP